MDEAFGIKVRNEFTAAALALLTVLLLFCGAAWAEDSSSKEERVVLNADRVSYNDETGQASARGNAVLNYRGTTIRAERIDYDAQTQKVEAMPLPGEQLVMTHSSGRTLKGDHLDYDLVTREGVLTGARTNLPMGEGTLFVYGGEIDVVPWDTAVERGLVHGQKGRPEDYAVQWHDVNLTTCALDHPHYRLVSKTITVIPGQRVIAKRPRIYLGNTYLFTSPLDYVTSFERRSVRYSLMPYFQRSDQRGVGGGINGTLGWDTGSLSLGVAGADKIGLEWMFEVEQKLSSEFTLRAGVDYTWDEAWDEKQWRPSASLMWYRDGWNVALNWKKNEYIEDQKSTLYDYKGRLDRRPEVVVQTPWYKTSEWSWLNLIASWGNFREEIYNGRTISAKRYGLWAHNYFERTLWPQVEFFSDLTGGVWFYDLDSEDHESLRTLTGLRYRLGIVELGTAYERRYVWGESPMLWDQYEKRERIHQKIRFPVARVGGRQPFDKLYAAARGSYDLDQSMVDEIIYSLQWVTDCMMWDLHFRNDRTSGGDNRIGLSLSILAFPETTASLGQRLERDPFDRPQDLPKSLK
ncbi:MAG: hypothetical protein K6E38_00760 [Fretibacterium sp.]|nr:hypothetical protein [Fretibacterium sp.]